MRFWDSSGLVPLIILEQSSRPMQEFYDEDAVVLVWWAAQVECVSALARRELLGATPERTVEALGRLDELALSWQEVGPTEAVRGTARRLLRVHDLRASDALQLAAALVASEGSPESLELVTLDDRLADAARREGFRILPTGL